MEDSVTVEHQMDKMMWKVGLYRGLDMRFILNPEPLSSQVPYIFMA